MSEKKGKIGYGYESKEIKRRRPCVYRQGIKLTETQQRYQINKNFLPSSDSAFYCVPTVDKRIDTLFHAPSAESASQMGTEGNKGSGQ